jgi:hypothetical protein
MFEHRTQPLVPRLRFLGRFLRSLILGFGIIGVSLACGMVGFHQLEHMPWVDAFLNASMLLSGMGPLGPPATYAGKIFAGSYALYSGFVVILASGIVFAPVVHRMMHRFHAHDAHPPVEHPVGPTLPIPTGVRPE